MQGHRDIKLRRRAVMAPRSARGGVLATPQQPFPPPETATSPLDVAAADLPAVTAAQRTGEMRPGDAQWSRLLWGAIPGPLCCKPQVEASRACVLGVLGGSPAVPSRGTSRKLAAGLWLSRLFTPVLAQPLYALRSRSGLLAQSAPASTARGVMAALALGISQYTSRRSIAHHRPLVLATHRQGIAC